MSVLVRNPEDQFSHIAAHIIAKTEKEMINILEVGIWIKSARPRMTLKACTLLLLLLLGNDHNTF